MARYIHFEEGERCAGGGAVDEDSDVDFSQRNGFGWRGNAQHCLAPFVMLAVADTTEDGLVVGKAA